MENTEFLLELDVTEVSTEQGYVSGGVTSKGYCKD
ncbi:bacteriocin [Streptococcus thermophilus]|nr:bacteriocin [Streptococcus thermophilus]MCE2198146.1 bacteriocin [Streptococcus thermophilus]MCE2201381.1 bacteriocin [Streptococcus thermophilus]MCE2204380.1 bacteriocin [Streptococcus thermophilus]MCE2223862.1 bacteriocin [Streptococcus thermophilus]